MSENKKKLTSEAKVLAFLKKAIDQQGRTPILEAQTVIDMGLQYTALHDAVNAKLVDVSQDSDIVIATNEAGKDLLVESKEYLKEMNANIRRRVGGNPKSVRVLFGMRENSARLPSMNNVKKLLGVTDTIRSGDASMVTAGYRLNIAFTAASVLSLRNIYKGLLADKSVAQSLITDNEIAIREAFTPAKKTAVDIERQVSYYYRHLTKSQRRIKMRAFGSQFKQSKKLTPITMQIKLPNQGFGSGAHVRIGLVTKKNGKPAKEGVKGSADTDGNIILKTVTTGKTFLIIRMPGYKDCIVPITIKAGVAQKIVVTLEVGYSRLGV